MRLLLRKRHKANPDAVKAIHEATQHLQRIQARDPEVKEVSLRASQTLERNHFREQLEIIMRGRHA